MFRTMCIFWIYLLSGKKQQRTWWITWAENPKKLNAMLQNYPKIYYKTNNLFECF